MRRAPRRSIPWGMSSGATDAAIESVVKSTGAELLVTDAYGHSPLRTFILGSTTTALMRACPVSVLLFR